MTMNVPDKVANLRSESEERRRKVPWASLLASCNQPSQRSHRTLLGITGTRKTGFTVYKNEKRLYILG